MRFHPLRVAGAMLVEADSSVDERGSFARLVCKAEFASKGLMGEFVQESVAYNRRSGTLRGFHFQIAPFEETKLVTCVRGSAYDVILDVRPNSPTFGEWCSIELYERLWTAVYIPAGCAHAVQSLVDDTELLYRISPPYESAAARGYRWNSPEIGVVWPFPDPILSERDRNLPLFQKARG